MNPEQTLNSIAEQMSSAAANHAGSILVCSRNKEVFVCRDTHRGNPMKIIARYKAEVVRTGLTPDEWRLLGRKIARALEEKS